MAVVGSRRLRFLVARRRSSASLGLALATAVIVPHLLAQANPSPQFRAQVDLAVIDVTVIDRDGRPVTGLTPDDFEVKLQGQRAPVRTLDFLRFATTETRTSASAPPPGPRVASNQSAAARGQSRGGRVIILLFDDLSFRPDEGIGLRVAAERELASFDPEDLVGVATTSGLGPVISPTRDRAPIEAVLHDRGLTGRADPDPGYYISILEALEAMEHRRGSGVFVNRECSILGDDSDSCAARMAAAGRALAQQSIERASMQLAAYTAVINALRAAPEPRIVVAFSGGIPLNMMIRPGQLDPITHAAASANVQLFTLTPYVEGRDLRDRGRPMLPPNDRRSARRAENEYLIDGAKSVAEAAGGEGFTVIGQADRFLERVLRETSAVYRLGVDAPASVKPQDLLKVKVAVHRSGASVHVRPAVTLPEPNAPPVQPETVLRSRIAQGGVDFGVPLEIGTVIRRDPDANGIQIGLEGRVPASTKGPVRAMFALIGSTGHVVRSGESSMASTFGDDYVFAMRMPLDAGDYRLRVGVVDADGHVGSIDRPLSARLNHFGSLAVSDVMLATSIRGSVPRALAVPEPPAAADTLHVEFEIYPDASQSLTDDVRVRLTLRRADAGVADAPITRQEVSPAINRTALVAASSLPLTALSTGTYDVVVTVIEGGKELGTSTTSFRKR